MSKYSSSSRRPKSNRPLCQIHHGRISGKVHSWHKYKHICSGCYKTLTGKGGFFVYRGPAWARKLKTPPVSQQPKTFLQRLFGL
jgi:hypothetical protein